jgi:hypothetical protein
VVGEEGERWLEERVEILAERASARCSMWAPGTGPKLIRGQRDQEAGARLEEIEMSNGG